MDVLVFTLAAPIGSYGSLAVGERRYGAERPGRSLVLGIVAAALGLDRADDAAHADLERRLGTAVRIDRAGELFDDYHTAQVPPARRGKRWPTRRAELAEPTLETILSIREYRTDVHVTPALWLREPGDPDLARIADALVRPHFRLCLGRRSCPLGRPPAPRVIPADSLVAAFDAYDRAAEEAAAPAHGVGLVADAEAIDFLGPRTTPERVVTRRDVVLSRSRWQFGTRQELVATLDPAREPVR